MIHLSKFLIGFRHKRVFRAKSMLGQIIDGILEECPEQFTRVTETHDREELILTDSKDTILLRNNKDDIILENAKLFDRETKKYVEADKKKLIAIAEKCLPVIARTIGLQQDFKRIGMIFEFRIPKRDEMNSDGFAQIIHSKFVNYPISALSDAEIAESSVRFAYKLRMPGGGVIRKFKDHRNVIIRVEESGGIDEDGSTQKCLFLSVDIQHYYDPSRKINDISIADHFDFAWDHLKQNVVPEFLKKGVRINYE